MKLNLESFSKPTRKSKEKPHHMEIDEELRIFLKAIFKEFQIDLEMRSEEIFERILPILKYIGEEIISKEKIEEIRNSLNTCAKIKDEKEYVDRAFEILKPLVDFERKYPVEFENARAKASNEVNGFVELNRLVSYEKEGSVVKIHHPRAYTVGPKLRMYYDAMRKLARVVEDDSEIKEIEGASWIVAKAPYLFTNKGFKVEKAKKHISSFGKEFTWGHEEDKEGRPISIATISREKFLEVFGVKN